MITDHYMDGDKKGKKRFSHCIMCGEVRACKQCQVCGVFLCTEVKRKSGSRVSCEQKFHTNQSLQTTAVKKQKRQQSLLANQTHRKKKKARGRARANRTIVCDDLDSSSDESEQRQSQVQRRVTLTPSTHQQAARQGRKRSISTTRTQRSSERLQQRQRAGTSARKATR